MKQFYIFHLGGVITVYVQRVRWAGAGKFEIKTNRYLHMGKAALGQLMDYADAHPLLAEFTDIGTDGMFIKISG
jgi:hypothetical protein